MCIRDRCSDEESSSSEGVGNNKGFYDSVSTETEETTEESDSEDSSSATDKDSQDTDASSDDESSSDDDDATPSKPFKAVVDQSTNDLLGGLTTGRNAAPEPQLESDDSTEEDSSSGDDDLLGNMTTSAPQQMAASTLDLGDIFGDDSASVGGARVGGLLLAEKVASNVKTNSTLPVTPLLNHVATRGLGVECQFVRAAGAADHNVIRLYFKNHSSMTIQTIKVSRQVDAGGLSMVPFGPISSLSSGATAQATININFNNKTQPARFEISDSNGAHKAALQPRVGELFYPYPVDVDACKATQSKLQGMNKTSGSMTATADVSVIDLMEEFTNLAFAGQEDSAYFFSGRTLSGGLPMVVVIEDQQDGNYTYDIHLENAILGSGFSAELKKEFAAA
eukprot:TRINITY_DN5194_c0_g2_i1.p1 TRINITY_DN5194_c0_g2~~TRINITY_DN5194_c0_g2_i1.p1  ORF type:complete len:394 (-),score=113.40 TRINITY_DN5194_c0_g2_i1:260-1441(-)